MLRGNSCMNQNNRRITYALMFTSPVPDCFHKFYGEVTEPKERDMYLLYLFKDGMVGTCSHDPASDGRDSAQGLIHNPTPVAVLDRVIFDEKKLGSS
ncbi:hypothetical protein Tco_0927072 [Tanacetum coccineum]|uniref:Uncharacterized protein n=1 Tax=Tanacetum coccineum TaxID=301880 RepID=A0ABQ5DCH0_9ASTR